MPELFHVWGNDLALAANGDLLLADATTRGIQRVLRRLLTNPNDYIFHVASPTAPAYGAGLPAKVGQTLNNRAIAGIIRAQIFLEESVARTPEPIITVTQPVPGTVNCSLKYNDAVTGLPVTLNFDIAR